jgi:hypothetical protein
MRAKNNQREGSRKVRKSGSQEDEKGRTCQVKKAKIGRVTSAMKQNNTSGQKPYVVRSMIFLFSSLWSWFTLTLHGLKDRNTNHPKKTWDHFVYLLCEL